MLALASCFSVPPPQAATLEQVAQSKATARRRPPRLRACPPSELVTT